MSFCKTVCFGIFLTIFKTFTLCGCGSVFNWRDADLCEKDSKGFTLSVEEKQYLEELEKINQAWPENIASLVNNLKQNYVDPCLCILGIKNKEA